MSEILIFVVFVVFSLLAVVASVGMLLSKNVLYSAFLLLLVFMSVAACYVLAGADFLAIAQIVVYVGGVLILLLFGIMLSNQSMRTNTVEVYETFKAPQSEHKNLFGGILAGLSMFSLLLYTFHQANFEEQSWLKTAAKTQQTIKGSTVQPLGIGFMTDYALAFELIALLLLVALIGSVTLAAYKK